MGLILCSRLGQGERVAFQIISDMENIGLFILCNHHHML